ncbi:hypothetical protein F5148DRAFT_1150733 [Russula earlei]|uniref:Uncharacterized protein n=1 Tax=Russula earlei TaxID=71964 RepID=A0ACC0U316_9AGAM|nr:hypothetical protein F5148DRAFT_1150733 [Russula earlei]
MSNSLMRRTLLGLFPLLVRILLRHYYSKLVKGNGKGKAVPLRRKELMYDAAFSITRNFMDTTTSHTVEEMQRLSQLRMPLPPSVHVVRIAVPLSCCAEAAHVLMNVFGGEREAKRVLGGVRWWQVRAGDQGIEAEWIMEKKDWQQSTRRETSTATPADNEGTNGSGSRVHIAGSALPKDRHVCTGSTDDCGCIPTGDGRDEMSSVGSWRWVLFRQRGPGKAYAPALCAQDTGASARLAPQYPFPCALQDFLASYLFLIQPPAGAAHRPVKPCNIIIGGDSAGGGLSIALLQVIRDAGLPQPAGAVLVSPWCDLFHTFPSIFLNTDTDVVPATGLTLFKPSALWPPPSDDVHLKMRELLHSSTLGVEHHKSLSEAEATANTADQLDIQPRFKLYPATTASSELDDTLLVKGEDGNPLLITRQIQLYTTNALLKHPLVSPVLAYLGGLPPLFIVASDREVLRDEIIYTAHRAANPANFPVSEEAKQLYPALVGVEGRLKPTMVHLQVYDDAAHVLPLAFGATTPAKYCYRAITTFIKHVTNMPPTAELQRQKRPPAFRQSDTILEEAVASPIAPSPLGLDRPGAPSQTKERSLSRPKGLSRITSYFRGGSHLFSKSPRSLSDVEDEDALEDILAGDPMVYYGGWAKSSEHQDMIRERVSIRGAIRPLEAEQDLPALQVVPERLGAISELWIHRYIAGTDLHKKKFAVHIKQLAKLHERAIANLHQTSVPHSTKEKATASVSPGWCLAWALEADECPPPSSLVARRDIAEVLVSAGGAKKCRWKRAHRSLSEKEHNLETKGSARVCRCGLDLAETRPYGMRNCRVPRHLKYGVGFEGQPTEYSLAKQNIISADSSIRAGDGGWGRPREEHQICIWFLRLLISMHKTHYYMQSHEYQSSIHLRVAHMENGMRVK